MAYRRSKGGGREGDRIKEGRQRGFHIDLEDILISGVLHKYLTALYQQEVDISLHPKDSLIHSDVVSQDDTPTIVHRWVPGDIQGKGGQHIHTHISRGTGSYRSKAYNYGKGLRERGHATPIVTV